MELKDLKPNMLVRIVANHSNGYGGRKGRVLEVGTFDLLSGGQLTGALIDIGETGLLVIEPECLEPVEQDPVPPGWEEFDI